MAVAKKAAKAAPKKVLTKTEKTKIAPKAAEIKIEAPAPGATVTVHTNKGPQTGRVVATHEGNRIDVVIIPAEGSNYSESAIEHKNNSEILPYWE